MSYKRRRAVNVQLDAPCCTGEWEFEYSHLPKRTNPRYRAEHVPIQGELQEDHPEIPAALRALDEAGDIFSVDFSTIKDDSLYRNLIYVTESLRWYETAIPTRQGSGKGILYQNLLRKSGFTDELDDLLKYSMRLSSSNSFWYGTADWPARTKIIKTMDDFYSPYHCLPFKRPQTEDILLILGKPPPVKETLWAAFDEKVLQLLHPTSERPFVMDDYERLKLCSSSSTFDADKLIRVRKTEKVAKTLDFQTPPHFTFDHVEVYKEPHESRACVVPDLDTLVTLTELEKRMEQVISCSSDCIRDTNFDWLPEYLSGYSRWGFLMSDQKKCGLTFNRSLIVRLYDRLHDCCPGWGFDRIHGWDSATIHLGDRGVLPFTNGVGLGMMNSTISLIVGILFEIWRDSQDPEFRLNGRFYNDDQVIRFWVGDRPKNHFHQPSIDLGVSWDNFLEDFGLVIHKKKPFTCGAGLFLEEYGSLFPVSSDKKVQKVCNLFKSLRAENIFRAKEMFCSSADALPPELRHYVPRVLRIVVSHWGSEFGSLAEELAIPFELGGWLHISKDGINSLFEELTNNHNDWWPYANFLDTVSEISRLHVDAKSSIITAMSANMKSLFPDRKLGRLFNYAALATSSLSARRIKGKERRHLEIKIMRIRQRGFKRKPLKQPLKILGWYREKIEGGSFYLPPLSLRGAKENVPWGPALLARPAFGSDSVPKMILKIQDLIDNPGKPQLRLSFRKIPEDLPSLVFHLCLSASHACGGRAVSPETVTLHCIGGFDFWNKVFHSQYSRGLPQAEVLANHPLTTFIMDLTGCVSPYEFIGLNDSTRTCWTTGLSDYPVFDSAESISGFTWREYYRRLVQRREADSIEAAEPCGWEDFREIHPIELPEATKRIASGNDPPDDEIITQGMTSTQLLQQFADIFRNISQEVAMRRTSIGEYLIEGTTDDIFETDDDVGLGGFFGG
jgi:hypothetical protein